MIGSVYSARVSAYLNALHRAHDDTVAMASAYQDAIGGVGAIAIRKAERLVHDL